MSRRIPSIAVALALSAACAHADSAAPQPASGTGAAATSGTQPRQSPEDAQALGEFSKRVDAYVALHTRLEKTLPGLPKETTPAVIDKHQRALAQLIQAERKQAARGDVFTPAAERVFRRGLGQIFAGRDGSQLKASIMDENPADVKLAVNSRYPDEVPLSTVPPQVLALLPKLPQDVEYRFIGDRLILLDVHAHLVVDYIDNVLPA